MRTRLEIEVVASVDVPETTRAPFEVSEEVAMNEPVIEVPRRVVEASNDVVVDVREPIVALPAVSDAAVAEVVAVRVPTVCVPIVALAKVAEDVEVRVPEVNVPIVALLAVRD